MSTNPNLPTFMIALDLSTCSVLAHGIAEYLARSMTYDTTPIDSWMTTDEVAQYLAIGKSEVHRLAAAGTLPSEQDGPGCKRYFRRSDLDDWRSSGGRRTY